MLLQLTGWEEERAEESSVRRMQEENNLIDFFRVGFFFFYIDLKIEVMDCFLKRNFRKNLSLSLSLLEVIPGKYFHEKVSDLQIIRGVLCTSK